MASEVQIGMGLFYLFALCIFLGFYKAELDSFTLKLIILIYWRFRCYFRNIKWNQVNRTEEPKAIRIL